MKIDYYTLGDSSDPATWSGTCLELKSTLDKISVLHNTYNIKPFQLYTVRPSDGKMDKIKFILKTMKFNYFKGRIYLITEYHPWIVEQSRKIALKTYNSNPIPDAIITHGDFAVFPRTPFFMYNDLDIKTLLNLRLKGEYTYTCDNMSIPVLIRRMNQQKEAYAIARGVMIASDWISKSIKSYIEDPEKVYTVGMGHSYDPINLSQEMIENRFEDPQLLFIGRNGMRKGIDIVLSAFEAIRRDVPETKLNIITNMNDLPRTWKNKLSEVENVEAYSAGVSKELLQGLFFRSSIFVMPSRFDAWGKVFFEAMAFGLPVIGAKNCAMPEFIRDDWNGYTVRYDPDEVVDKILSLFNSFGKYKTMSENSVHMSKMYTWEIVAKNMVNIINKSYQ